MGKPLSLFMTEKRKIATALADSTLSGELIRAPVSASRLQWVDYLLIVGLSVLCALAFNRSNFEVNFCNKQ